MTIQYGALNNDVFNLVPIDVREVLDLGCGNGVLGMAIHKKTGASVTGITFSEEEYKTASMVLHKVYKANLNNFDFLSLGTYFDCIICSHVLEHLLEPWDIVKKLEQIIKPNGLLVIALPNCLYYKQRLQFLLGKFSYSKTGGLMDITHFRFFDWNSCSSVLEKTNMELVQKFATGNFPQPFLRKLTPEFSKILDNFFVRLFPGLFGFQILMVAQFKQNKLFS